MPYDKNHTFYPDPITLPDAQIAFQYMTATETHTAFDFESARELIATLKVSELLKTALSGSNNDLVFMARVAGSTPTVRIAYVDPSANNAALGIVVSGQDITVNLATGVAGAITTTAAQIKAAIEANAEANALVAVALAPSNDGTGVVTALSQATLAAVAGTNPTLDVKLQCSTDGGVNYFDVASFAQKTTVGVEGKLFTGVTMKGRWVLTITGTAEFAVAIDAVYRPNA